MAFINLFTRKYAKIILVVMLVLVCSQYLLNALIAGKMPLSLVSLLDRNSSVLFFQRALAANYSVGATTARPKLELCPIIPPTLKGPVSVNIQIPSWAFIEEDNQRLDPGGRFKPRECVARHRVAVIIPFRDREIHLKIFLQNIHPFLQRQQLDYGIFVVELVPEVKFNRALLMNIGFVEALKSADYQCFIFHDVDLIPEDDRNLYTCPESPRHMSVAIDRLGYRLPYAQLFGGVSAIKKEHFKKINGFSNLYFGWGGEDDDMYRRILYSNLTVSRYSPKVARYKMLVHKKESGNPQRFNLLRDMRRRHLKDGLSSLNYTIVKTERKLLYTWILIRVDQKEVLRPFTVRVSAKKPPIPPPIIPKRKVVKQNQASAQMKVPGQKPPQRQIQPRQPSQGAKPKQVQSPKVLQQNSKPPQRQLQPRQPSQGAKSKPVQDIKVIQQNPKPPVKKKAPLPKTIDWIPIEFKGHIPDYLTNYDHLKKPVRKDNPAIINSKSAIRTVNQNSKSAMGVVKTHRHIDSAVVPVNAGNDGVVKEVASNINGGLNANKEMPPTNIKHAEAIVKAADSLLPKEVVDLVPYNVNKGKTPVPQTSITDSPEYYKDSTGDVSTTTALPSKVVRLSNAGVQQGNVIMERDAVRLNDAGTLP